MKKLIYMDNAATTRITEPVLEAMMPFLTEHYGNPSSLYEMGQFAKSAVQNAREQVAKSLNCDAKEVFFTSCGSESDNWAIKGAAFANRKKGNHIITSKIEHHAVLHTCEYLEKNGFEVTYLDVDSEGFVTPEQLEAAIKDNTILVSIMMANNEIGTIEPIKELAEVAHNHGVLFHTDAVQAVGNIPVDVKDLGVDMLSLSGHKIHAPKGVGVLYVRKGVRPEIFMHGGGQEKGRRAGTENLASIVGLGKAIELADANLAHHMSYLTELRDYLIAQMESKISNTLLNGPRGDKRLPGNFHMCYEFIEGESILLSLDFEGICGSSGSACTSGSLDPSHVLLAIGRPHEIAHGSLRLSLSEENTKEDIDFVVEKMVEIVDRFRQMSPLYHDYLKGGK